MKKLVLLLALAVSSIAPLSLHADNIGITLKTGAGIDTLIETPILNGTQWVYTNTTLGVLHNSLLQASTSVVTITYVDALGTLGVFNVNDVCTSVTIVGEPVPCQQFALSFTNVTLGDLSLVAALGVNVDLNVGSGLLTFGGSSLIPQSDILGVSIAGGSATIDCTNPNPPPAVPEPATISLMATGLAGAAGMLRRRFAAASSN
jgi:hypothetical protein